jgi:hypothetical protein
MRVLLHEAPPLQNETLAAGVAVSERAQWMTISPPPVEKLRAPRAPELSALR